MKRPKLLIVKVRQFFFQYRGAQVQELSWIETQTAKGLYCVFSSFQNLYYLHFYKHPNNSQLGLIHLLQ